MLLNEVKEKLIAIVTKNNFDDSKIERLVYSYDATPNFQSMPDAVVSPRNTEEVSEILKVCNQYKVPIVPRGSGTNLCAGTCPTEGGVVILFKHMNQILEIDEENLTITVQPGVISMDMIMPLRKRAYFIHQIQAQ